MSRNNIHPFPARMAPEIAFEIINGLPKNSILLDPMTGSGTTLQLGARNGCHCFGADVDPLALLITHTALTYIKPESVLSSLDELVNKVERCKFSYPSYWDEETKDFANFWFANKQLETLSKLSQVIINNGNEELKNLYKVALSRCIITKEKGASLASDVSHAKPHKTKSENTYDVLLGFQQGVKHTLSKSIQFKTNKRVKVFSDDARNLITVESQSIDCIITSPPYLHAVDYFRGHRLSLIWMGYNLKDLRQLRANSIGLQKNPKMVDEISLKPLLKDIGEIQTLPNKQKNHLYKYAIDIKSMTNEFYRVLKKKRQVTVVIANAWSAGVEINNTKLIKNAAKVSGLKLVSQKEREIPANKRYLPPPEYITNSALDKRMKNEAILTFVKS